MATDSILLCYMATNTIAPMAVKRYAPPAVTAISVPSNDYAVLTTAANDRQLMTSYSRLMAPSRPVFSATCQNARRAYAASMTSVSSSVCPSVCLLTLVDCDHTVQQKMEMGNDAMDRSVSRLFACRSRSGS